MSAESERTPILIPLSQGLGVNGVALWALRLSEALVQRGWTVGLTVHGEPSHHANAGHSLPNGVRAYDLRHLPPLSDEEPMHPYVHAYREALTDLGWSADTPAVFLPNLDPKTFAIAASLASSNADQLRVVGWQHSDTPFDATLLTTYEPMLSAMVGVSSQIAAGLRDQMVWRAEDIKHVPSGVEVPQSIPPRKDGPIRLVYTGRLEHEQKRIGVLLEIAKLLHEADVEHTIRLIGDGPAASEVAMAAKKLTNLEWVPPASRAEIVEHLQWADLKILASRYEGLSISMLEAMAHGVVPIISRVRSGALDAIEHGVSGLLVDAGPEEADITIAERFGDAVLELAEAPDRLARMRNATHERAKANFDISRHADACEALFRDAIAAEPRWWPLDRPCAFGSATGGGGSVPPDAAERAAKALSREPGPLAIYGAGRHTKAIGHVLAGAKISCVIDDDRMNHGHTLWGWPVVSLDKAPPDASVLISSFMHQKPMAERVKAKGMRAITLY
ncbi:MAG: glycosyltransferase [Phycisphaerales bacterium]|jgi:glycosyltransferase involved in cell wall biosynthesis